MFNLFDVIFLVILAAGGWFGFKTGFVASSFYLVSGFTAMAAARAYSAKTGADFTLVFTVTVLAAILVGYLLGRIVGALIFGIFDRLGGALLGIILGLLAAAFVVTTLPPKFSPQSREMLLSSFTAARVIKPVQKAASFVPGMRHPRARQNGMTDKKTYKKIFSTMTDKLNLEVTRPSGSDTSEEKKREQ